MHPVSRIRTALAWAGVAKRVLRPISKMTDSPAITDSTERGATPDPFQGVMGDRADPVDVAADPSEFGGVTVQGGDVDDGVEVWWVATGFGTLVIPMRQVRNGVTTPLREGTYPVGGILRVGGCQMVQHVQQFGAGDRFEVEIPRHPTIHRHRRMQPVAGLVLVVGVTGEVVIGDRRPPPRQHRELLTDSDSACSASTCS